MADKCMHRLSDGCFCKRWASNGSRFCSHHQGSVAQLQHSQDLTLHPLARLTTPEDIFDLLRETLNATRLGRISPGQAFAISCLVREWRRTYDDLLLHQRTVALHRQMIVPDLMATEAQQEEERAEAPHPLPVRVDSEAVVAHSAHEPTPPLKPPTDYPGWAELYGRRAGDRAVAAAPAQAAPAAPAAAPGAPAAASEVLRRGAASHCDAKDPQPKGCPTVPSSLPPSRVVETVLASAGNGRRRANRPAAPRQVGAAPDT